VLGGIWGWLRLSLKAWAWATAIFVVLAITLMISNPSDRVWF